MDLGLGSGALAARLGDLGFEVTAVDLASEGFGAHVPFIPLDLNEPDFAARLGPSSFDLVTAVEVVEDLESPIGFLRNVADLLDPKGVAVVTTPNVENGPPE